MTNIIIEMFRREKFDELLAIHYICQCFKLLCYSCCIRIMAGEQ